MEIARPLLDLPPASNTVRTRPPNRERSSPISQTLSPNPLFSELRFTGSAIGGQLAGSGNIAIRSKNAANRPRVRHSFRIGSRLLRPILAQQTGPTPMRKGGDLLH
jgi:hypothetical protein